MGIKQYNLDKSLAKTNGKRRSNSDKNNTEDYKSNSRPNQHSIQKNKAEKIWYNIRVLR